MGFKDKDKEKLRQCLVTLLAKSQGHWVSVDEYSFSALATDCNIERRLVGFLIATLKEENLMEVTGINRWTRYKTSTAWSDVDKIIENCEFKYELWVEEQKDSKKRRNDNKPLFVKDTNMTESNGQPIILKKPKYHAMESKVFVMKENRIYEGMVVGITPSENGYKHQLQFNTEVKTAVVDCETETKTEPEFFSYHCLFPTIQALIVNLEKNAIRLSSRH